jgi:hypothetical protein
MCVEVEVVDVPLNYNLLLGRIWTYEMCYHCNNFLDSKSWDLAGS